jgi:hypothetical protein
VTLAGNRVTVEKAAIRALKRYLEKCFQADEFWGGKPVHVNDYWPSETKLPPRVVSIIEAGRRDDVRQQAILVKSEELDPTTGVYTWAVAACTQPIQLDVWGRDETTRNSLVASLDDYLRRGTRYTLDDPLGDPIGDTLLLRLKPEDGHEGYADVTIGGPSNTDTPDAVERKEFRSTYSGEISVELCVRSTEKRLLRVQVEMALGHTDPKPPFNFEITA